MKDVFIISQLGKKDLRPTVEFGEHVFECMVSPFYNPLALRVVRDACDVFDSELGTKLFELLASLVKGPLSVLMTFGCPMAVRHCRMCDMTCLVASRDWGVAKRKPLWVSMVT